MRRKRRLAQRIGVVGLAAALAVAAGACQPIRDYRGFVPREGSLERVQIGMSRAEVEELLGTPSATSTVAGTSYYYISSVFETTAFLAPEEVDRQVYAIWFDDKENVSRIAHYGLKDGKVFDFVSRTTPTRGKELTVLQQLFGNIGRFNPDPEAAKKRVTQ